MISEENEFWQAGYFDYQGYKIFYRYFIPAKPYKLSLVLLHGRYTHSGYWDLLFNKNIKYGIYAIDYPGQGKSSGKRGSCDTYKTLPLLLTWFINHEIPSKTGKIILLGESLGALLAAYCATKFEPKPVGLVFIPGVFNIPILNKKRFRWFLKILNLFSPNLILKNRKPFSSYTTKNIDVLRRLESDNHYCRESSIRYIWGIAKFIEYLKQHAYLISSSLLIFHGKNDHYGTISEVKSFLNRLPSETERKLIILEDSKHWLLVGNEISQIKKHLIEWLDEMERRL